MIGVDNQFEATENKTKAPFNWMAAAGSILEKLKCCVQFSGNDTPATTLIRSVSAVEKVGLASTEKVPPPSSPF